jgi:hypothetical protein
MASPDPRRQFGAPVLPRGAGTSLAGQCCNVAVVLDFTKYMNRILEIDPKRRFARVQPGVVLDSLRNAAEAHNLTFGPDPSTHSRCSLGGMIGNNSCGTHSLLAGKTVDNVEELHILLYDGTQMTVGATDPAELDHIIREGGRRGEIYGRLKALRDRYADQIRARFPQIPRRVSGYNLDELLPERGFNVARALIGTEGTCAVVLDAKVKLIHSPQHRALVGVGYSDKRQIVGVFEGVWPVGERGAVARADRHNAYRRTDKNPESCIRAAADGAPSPTRSASHAARVRLRSWYSSWRSRPHAKGFSWFRWISSLCSLRSLASFNLEYRRDTAG